MRTSAVQPKRSCFQRLLAVAVLVAIFFSLVMDKPALAGSRVLIEENLSNHHPAYWSNTPGNCVFDWQ